MSSKLPGLARPQNRVLWRRIGQPYQNADGYFLFKQKNTYSLRFGHLYDVFVNYEIRKEHFTVFDKR